MYYIAMTIAFGPMIWFMYLCVYTHITIKPTKPEDLPTYPQEYYDSFMVDGDIAF